MWSWVTDQAERFVLEYGLLKPASGIASAIAVLAAFGLAIPNLLAAAAVALVLLLLLLAALQGVDRRRLYNRLSDNDRILTRYSEDLRDRIRPDSFDIVEWREEHAVGKHGDTTVDRWFTLRVGAEPLPTFWLRAYKTPPTPAGRSRAYQEKVVIEARTFDEHGDLGTRIATTRTWNDDSVTINVHLRNREEPNATLRVRVRCVWPGLHDDLIDRGGVVPTEWTFRRRIENLKLLMVFAPELKLRTPLAVSTYAGCPAVAQTVDASGARTLSFEMNNPPRGRSVGFEHELGPS